MFLSSGLDETPTRSNVKCDPDTAIALREPFPDSVFPGWHMNKKYWNTVYVNGHLPDSLLVDFIFNSYSLVHLLSYM